MNMTSILMVESLKQAIIDAKNLNLRPSVIVSVDLFGYPSDFDLVKQIPWMRTLNFSLMGPKALEENTK